MIRFLTHEESHSTEEAYPSFSCNQSKTIQIIQKANLISPRSSLTGGSYLWWNHLPFPQDTLGGGFDATQAFVGDLANFHIWDRKLSVGEIYNLATCSSKAQVGNVFAWMETSLDIYGGASKWTFEACRQLNWTAGRRRWVNLSKPLLSQHQSNYMKAGLVVGIWKHHVMAFSRLSCGTPHWKWTLWLPVVSKHVNLLQKSDDAKETKMTGRRQASSRRSCSF